MIANAKKILNVFFMLVSLALCIGLVVAIHSTDNIIFIVLCVLGFAAFSYTFLATLSGLRHQ